MGTTHEIAKFIVELRYSDLPAEAINVTKKLIVDGIGVMLYGSQEPQGKIISEYVREMGGVPDATVIAGGFKVPAPQAALANGTMAHAMDYDDLMMSFISHPTSVILPAVLALGEKHGISGKEVIQAYVLGFEVMSRIGTAIWSKHFEVGWHPTATIGVMGAVAAAAKVLNLNIEQTRMAIGIAASHGGGLRQNFGTMTKSLHSGKASQNGVVAAILARKGFTAYDGILESPIGYCHVLSCDTDYELNRITDGLGEQYDIISPGVIIKYYPSCGGSHRFIEAALHLRNNYGFSSSEVAEVDLIATDLTPQVLFYSHPQKSLEARFSIQYCVAVALIDGELGLQQFSDERVQRTDVQELLTRVRYVSSEGITGVEAYRQTRAVRIRLFDGREYTYSVEAPKGYPKNPLSWEELTSKYRECACSVISEQKVRRSLELLFNLEQLTEISELMKVVA